MVGARIYTYQVYDLIISSEIELKELKPCETGAEVDLKIKVAHLDLMHSDPVQNYVFSEDRQVIVFPDVGGFIIEGRDTIFVEPAPDVSEDLLALPLLGPILAILLHLRRTFTLHGSAVLYNEKAYGFIGDKGAGKSTLAAMLLRNPEVDFLTDDLLVISDELEVLRGYPQMKLSDEALKHFDTRLGHVRPPPIEDFPKNQFLLSSHLPEGGVQIGGIFELR